MNSDLTFRHAWLALWFVGLMLGTYIALRPVTPEPQLIPYFDKFIHAFSYFMLAVFAVCLFKKSSTQFILIIGLVLFGIGIELAQGYLPTGHLMEFYDFVANCIGIAFGVLLARRWNVLLAVERMASTSKAKWAKAIAR